VACLQPCCVSGKLFFHLASYVTRACLCYIWTRRTE
jgi:hypothetical protein